MRKALMIIICVLAIFLNGCFWFESVDQPTSALPNEIVTVNIEVLTSGSGDEYRPCFGVCLPNGWNIPGDSILCGGVYNQVIYYDSLNSINQEETSPAPENYFWWMGVGVGSVIDSGIISGTFEIQTSGQFGLYLIDYVIGYPGTGSQERSDDHPIGIVDEYMPRGLCTVRQENSIVHYWHTPVVTEGLLGYNFYRDQQQLNQDPLIDTLFIDESPHEGIQHYAVSSLYDDDTEHLIPYELPVIFGNLYVSPSGDNANNGSSFDDALQTITYAISIISPDSIFPQDIVLAPGIYSQNTNGEQFPVSFINYLSLKGSGEDVTIIDADNQSGVFAFEYIHSASIESLTVTNGSAFNGGGIYCYESSPSIRNVKITGNYAERGGGIYCYESDVFIKDVTISNNVAGDHGGGACFNDSEPKLNNVVITGNTAYNSAAGIFCYYNANPRLINVTLTDNTAGYGCGGIYSYYSSHPDLTNCILWNDYPSEIASDYPEGVNVIYSDIQGGWEGEGNIDIDPLFRDPENGDFHLMFIECDDPYDSPCIDAGDPAILDSLLDCDWGMGWYRSDMGAYGGGDSAQVSINDFKEPLPAQFNLSQNYPNPFNASTVIRYDLPCQSQVTIDVYDILGRQVGTIDDGLQSAGKNQVTWRASDLPSGVYFYKLQAGEYSETKKMLLLK